MTQDLGGQVTFQEAADPFASPVTRKKRAPANAPSPTSVGLATSLVVRPPEKKQVVAVIQQAYDDSRSDAAPLSAAELAVSALVVLIPLLLTGVGSA